MIIGSRKSDLAVIQAESIAEHLKSAQPHLQIDFFQRPSMGDLNLDIDLNQTGSKGVFTADFIEHLKKGDCDVVVHSWKDLPIDIHPEFTVLAGPQREDQRDILFLKRSSYAKPQIQVMTSSPRREFQLRNSLGPFLPFKTEISFQSIRGNIPTRFKKFLDSDCDAFVVAKAAVDRLMGSKLQTYKAIQEQIQDVFNQCHWMVLPLSEFPTAAAQGALALELQVGSKYLPLFDQITNSEIKKCVELERQTHKSYGGGCHQAMGFSALALQEGILFFTSGLEDQGLAFKTKEWRPYKPLLQKFNESEIFVSSRVNVTRRTLKTFLQLQARTEYVVARNEAWPETLTSEQTQKPDVVLWAAGVKTWHKLAARGVWVNGCLDGLGLEHKPSFEFFKDFDKMWLTHTEASAEHLGGFTKVPMYEVSYNLNPQDLEDKKIFFWSSAELFHKAFALRPEILKQAKHVCGLGRTSWALRSKLQESQMYYALDEQDFLQRALS